MDRENKCVFAGGVSTVIFHYLYTIFKPWKSPAKYLHWVKVIQAAEIPSNGLLQFYVADLITLFRLHSKTIHHLYQTVSKNRNLTRLTSYLMCAWYTTCIKKSRPFQIQIIQSLLYYFEYSNCVKTQGFYSQCILVNCTYHHLFCHSQLRDKLHEDIYSLISLPNLYILTLYTYTNKNNTHGQMPGYTQQLTPITAAL